MRPVSSGSVAVPGSQRDQLATVRAPCFQASHCRGRRCRRYCLWSLQCPHLKVERCFHLMIHRMTRAFWQAIAAAVIAAIAV